MYNVQCKDVNKTFEVGVNVFPLAPVISRETSSNEQYEQKI